MVRLCDACQQVIEQADDEYLQLAVRVLDVTESPDQDAKEHAYGDFCDRCIANGAALDKLLTQLGWKLEPHV